MKKIWLFIKWFFLAVSSIFMGDSIYSGKGKQISGNEKLIALAMLVGFILIYVGLAKTGLL